MEYLTLRPAPDLEPLDVALQAFLLHLEAAGCTPKTLTHYRYTVGGFVAFLKTRNVSSVADVTPQDVRAYLVSLQKRNLKDTTQHAHARGIRAWCNWLVREGDLEASPMARVAMPRLQKRVPAPFSPDDVAALLDACDRKSLRGARDYAMILTLLDTGLRAAEFCSLQVGSVDRRSGLIIVMGKGGKQRTVRAGAKARAAMLRMLAHRAPVASDAPLWMAYNLDGSERGALTINGLQTILHRLGKHAGVMPCGPHRFRRTFALWCLRDGMDLHSLRMLMGHSDLTVLQRYLALAGEDLERVHKAHSPADKLLG